MVKIYKQPFAHDGYAIAIPDASQPDGQMSNADGWTPDYQLPKTDPNYKPVGRQEMNGVFKEVTEALGQVQVQGAASWSADGAPYPINAQVYHNGKQWIALRENSVEPSEGEDWNGALRPATPEQAQELTAGDVAITPETLAAAFAGPNVAMGTASGYQIFPGEMGNRLMIQWGGTPASHHGQRVVFPMSFGVGVIPRLSITPAKTGISIPNDFTAFTDAARDGFTYLVSTTSSSAWLAIGSV